MDMLSALRQINGENPVARPVAWQGTGRGIVWLESDEQSPFPWTFGWREIGEHVPCNVDEATAKRLGRAKIPDRLELFGEWEVVDRKVIDKENGVNV
jgi:hypothetical protein